MPIIATTSASMWPRTNASIEERCAKPGARGREVDVVNHCDQQGEQSDDRQCRHDRTVRRIYQMVVAKRCQELIIAALGNIVVAEGMPREKARKLARKGLRGRGIAELQEREERRAPPMVEEVRSVTRTDQRDEHLVGEAGVRGQVAQDGTDPIDISLAEYLERHGTADR